jgi:disulfide bond formation protein DsbB
MSKIEISSYLKLVFFVSLLAIISAYFIEYVLGHQPCNLCLIERIPYVSSLIIVLVNYRYKQITKYSILLLSLIFFFSLIISIYHYGIEQGFFQESIVCGIKDSTNILSKEELLEELQKKVINCKDVTFRIFGFSLTTINIIVSLLILILSIKIFVSYEKKK